ncbi:MAG: hypothetical protein ACYTG0_21955 [Planctomycetota bacterium]|jgi:hypothetical protein
MDKRIAQELELLRRQYPDLVHKERWVRIARYELVDGWVRAEVPVAFFIREGYPGVSPYGIYVPVGTRYQGQMPKSYKEPAKPQPPFDGTWGVFSWEAASWHPTADPEKGHNLLNWAQGFIDRFKEGL